MSNILTFIIMSTGQKYSGKGETTTSTPPKGQNAAETSSTADNRPLGDSKNVRLISLDTIKVRGDFGDNMSNPRVMNWLRQDLRAWFMAYIPEWEGSYSSSDLEGSIRYYQMLDEFLGDLIEAGIERFEGAEDLSNSNKTKEGLGHE